MDTRSARKLGGMVAAVAIVAAGCGFVALSGEASAAPPGEIPRKVHCSSSSDFGGAKRKALVVQFRCNIDLLDVELKSSTRRIKVRRHAWSSVGKAGDPLICRAKSQLQGGVATCKARGEGFATRPVTYRVAVRVPGDRCAVNLKLKVFGGVFCDVGVFCPDIGLGTSRRVPKPNACS